MSAELDGPWRAGFGGCLSTRAALVREISIAISSFSRCCRYVGAEDAAQSEPTGCSLSLVYVRQFQNGHLQTSDLVELVVSFPASDIETGLTGEAGCQNL